MDNSPYFLVFYNFTQLPADQPSSHIQALGVLHDFYANIPTIFT